MVSLPIRQNLNRVAGLRAEPKAVLIEICELIENGGHGLCWATNKSLAERLGKPLKSVSRLVSKLDKEGWLQVTVRDDQGNRREIRAGEKARAVYARSEDTLSPLTSQSGDTPRSEDTLSPLRPESGDTSPHLAKVGIPPEVRIPTPRSEDTLPPEVGRVDYDHNTTIDEQEINAQLIRAFTERDAAIAAGVLAEKKIMELEAKLKKGRQLYRELQRELADALNQVATPKPTTRTKRPSGEQFASDPLFVVFWNDFDNKKNKKRVLAVWATLTAEQRQMAADKAKPYALSTPELKYRRNPDHWLNEHNFTDEALPVTSATKTSNGNQQTVHRPRYALQT